MSTEKTVRVRVKVYDNMTSIYSQDIEISGGEGSFIVPAIMADSELLTLQAELVSVEGKEIESHYVLAREPIYKWNSSSDCYLLIEGVQNTLQPDNSAHVNILSTCSCEQSLHYIITTDGRITGWDERRFAYPGEPPSSLSSTSDNAPLSSHTADANGTCQLNFSFTVKSVMAPISQLLVYYVTPQGEPVSDFISFNVKLISDKIQIKIEDREWWLPEQDLDLDVSVEESSVVCILGGRSGTGNDIRFNPHKSEETISKSVREQSDFLETGLTFSQDRCSTDARLTSMETQKQYTFESFNNKQLSESLIGSSRVDELWLWKCFNYSKEISSLDLGLTTPEQAGEWSLWAIAVTQEGLQFSPPISLTVFRPLQTDFRLPANLRVGETVEVDIKIVNNLNTCMDVTALLALSEGAQFISNGLLYVTERLRLGPQGATSLVVRLMVTLPGIRNLTVEVNGYSSPSCEGSETNASNATLVGAIIKSGTIDVHPEGILKTTSENAYFCANENTIISTADNYKFEWIPATRNKAGLILEAKVTTPNKIGPLYLALAESRFSKDRMYRISIGDKDNRITWISKGKFDHENHLKSVNTPGILSLDEWQRFWLIWDKNLISFGKGSVANNQTLLSWKVSKKFKIQELGFASAWGSTVEIRIWNFNDESGFSQVLHLDTPKSVVPGSETGKLLITSGLVVPTLPTLERLEGGLLRTLSSISSLIANSKKFNGSCLNEILLKHIQKVMVYRKVENSFSEHRMIESHISTLATLEVLMKAQNLVNIDPDLLDSMKRWLQMRQEDDGSFTPLPADVKYSYNVINTNKNDVLLYDQIAEITAETVIGFYEIGIEDDSDVDAIQKAKIFLENSLPEIKTSEALAAVTLALVLLKSATSSWAIEKLRNASTTEDGEFGWPQANSKRDAADWLYESDNAKVFKEPVTGTLEDFKGSLYALSVFSITGDLKMAESVTRYLFYRSYVLDVHPELLYRTVEALSQYNQLVKNHHQSLTVSLATSGMELTDTILLTPEKPTQELHLPSLPTKVFIYATGAGCGTIQGKMRYSSYESQHNATLFDLSAQVVQEILPGKNSVEEIEGKLPILKIRTCFRWKGPQPSGVIRVEIFLFSGYELTCPNQIVIEPQKYVSLTEYGYNSGNVWFIVGNITDDCLICFQFIASSSTIITSLRPAYARIYPPSREDLASSVFFHAKSGSSLLRGIADDDLITWFGKDAFANRTQADDSVTCMKDCNSCQAKVTKSITADKENATEDVPKEILPASPEETEYPIHVNQKSINVMIEDMEDRSENISSHCENREVDFVTTSSLNGTSTDESDLNNNKNVSSAVSSTITSIIESSSLDNDIDRQESTESTDSLPKNETLTDHHQQSAQTYVPKHVNTKISDVSLKYLQQIDDQPDTSERDFDPDVKNDRYILLDKKELWGLLKEAVSDQIEEKLRRSEKEITKNAN
ncbi:C3 and PZP-like alpha-2-macroglobulin domain-containing protein 8 [Agrilus planipennis]|uniref:C3 and PZP-like alpha-2-macroglobulin domain-containing protein 8 n=1 Tax=Agrilus planipennis TaxID=224129 RepID=A0A7F5R8J7_AGRPL|nr:C3 and PZP-like alpha-2-macroglobulin domain-containing protein 8 [Agrilus planipennis]